MSRKRYYWNIETKQLEEVGAQPDPVARLQINGDSHYSGARGIDGSDIGSRRRHSEHMKQHGLALADDFSNHWQKAAADRARFNGVDPESGKFTGTSGWDRESRRADVAAEIRKKFKR